jgi:MFS family permease
MADATGRDAGVSDTPRDVAPSRLPRALRPLHHRQFRLLAMSGAASLLADGLWLVALVWQVIAMGGGPSDLSVVAAATSLGLVAAALLGGVAADRLPKRAVLVCVEVARTAVPVVAGLLAVSGVLQIWSLAALAFAVGAAGGFYYPVWSAVVPVLLPAEELLAANGIEGMLRPLAQQAAGPALAGLLVGAFSPSVALLGAGVCYLAALVPLLAMRPVPRSTDPDDGAPSPTRQLVEGFAYLLRTGWLFATLAFAILYILVIMGPIEVLLPFAVRDRVGAGPAGLSLVLAAYGVGCATGAFVVSSLRLPRRYLTVMLLCWGFGALPLAAFGLSTVLWIMVVAGLAIGLTDAAAMVIWGTLLQRRVPTHLLGRVSSLDFFVSLALMPLSTALAGPVGERVGIPVTFVVAAVVPPVLAVVALLAWRLPRDEIAHPIDQAEQPAEKGAVQRAPRAP